jgi:hypothetical protein
MAMTNPGKRFLFRCMLAVGILLCLTPSAAMIWASWKLVYKPLIEQGPDKFRQPDQMKLQRQMQREPIVNLAYFVAAPAGVALIITSLVLLRRLRNRPPPMLPADYGLGRGQ